MQSRARYVCFVAHIEGPLNVDIDIVDPSFDIMRYKPSVVSKQYRYFDLKCNTDGSMEAISPRRTGSVCRARLAGISMKQVRHSRGRNEHSRYDAMANESMKGALNYVLGFMNNCHRWTLCTCEPKEDRFDRLIVRLYDPITDECLNDRLLHLYPDIIERYGGNSDNLDPELSSP
jgi:hypothetical protein